MPPIESWMLSLLAAVRSRRYRAWPTMMPYTPLARPDCDALGVIANNQRGGDHLPAGSKATQAIAISSKRSWPDQRAFQE